MADDEITHPVESGKASKVEELNGLNFDSFEQSERMNTFMKNQRKRFPTRSYAGFALSTLSLTNDVTTRVKKRNRKDDKRVVIDRVDGFSFISALTLNDFDEYEKNPVKHPLAPTKRKASTKTAPTVPRKKVKSPAVQELDTSVKAEDQQGEKAEPLIANEMDSNVPGKKPKMNVSPLTKSALVRLKKINLCGLNDSKNSLINQPAKNSMTTEVMKSLNLKTSSGKGVLSKNRTKGKKDNMNHLVHMGQHSGILSDDEDSTELDICGVDESSSSQFIKNNISMPDGEQFSGPFRQKNEKESKQKRKPCRVCCAYPCRIVGARRVKSSDYQFPSFDVSFTSRCHVHTPGEITAHESSLGKVNVCIQTTYTDIRMHLDFARRFPYHAISVVSCQPSLYDDDLKLPDTITSGTTQRCSEHHRVLEQKRREELHGLYCKLADTLSISKNRASKQWILENAIREIKCLEAKDKLLTTKINSEKIENGKKMKRWEELAGKPYVAPEKCATNVAGKSKFLELYEIYRQEREQAEEKSKSKESEMKNLLKIKDGIKKEIQKKIMHSKRQQKEVNNEGKNVEGIVKQIEINRSTTNTLSNNDLVFTPVLKNPGVCEANVLTPKDLKYTFPSKNLFVGPQTNNVLPVSTPTLKESSNYTSLGPQRVARPFQHQSVTSTLSGTQAIPKIDLTSEPEASTPKVAEQIAVNTPGTAPSNLTPPLFKSPPPTQNSSRLQSDATSTHTFGKTSSKTIFPTRISPEASKHSPVSPPNTDCVVIRLVEQGKTTIVKIPKSQEGLTMLNKLCSMNKLNAESAKKIAAHIPVKRSLQPAATTTSSQATPTSLQWSTVASIPKTSAAPGLTSQVRPVNATSNESDKFARNSATGLSRVVNVRERNTDIPQQQQQQQQKKLVYFDLNNTNKPESNALSLMPTSSSINVTLNKLGSITANKVFNKSPVPVTLQKSVSKSPDASFIESCSSSKNCHLTLTPPVRVHMPTTSLPICPRPPQVLTEEPPVDLPEFPPDISPDLTKASFSPLEAIPQISDTLLGGTCQNESGLCIISNVFSLTDTTNVSTSRNLEKTSGVAVKNLTGTRDPSVVDH